MSDDGERGAGSGRVHARAVITFAVFGVVLIRGVQNPTARFLVLFSHEVHIVVDKR